MKTLNSTLSWIAWTTACIPVLIGPWLFGSWEMWWFWPMAVLIFLSTGIFGVRLIMKSRSGELDDITENKPALIAVASILPFLIYALIRACTAEVYMDAERSFLLFLLPILLGTQVAFGFTEYQRKLLYCLLLVDLLSLGTYGVVNHFMTQNRYVLFAEGYKLYYMENRATGSYFCPDHFAGIMELAFCMALGILMTRRMEWQTKLLPAVLMILAAVGVILSKSRGGGVSLVVAGTAAIIWGFSQWRRIQRWYYRFIALCFLTLLVLLAAAICKPYVKRFMEPFGLHQERNKPLSETLVAVGKKLRANSRGHMISGALHAWKTSPIWGIGPGMHQNLWPHFSNSMDGDRETGTWPTYIYIERHSYEVHCDWVQLLEEYGAVGFLLFLIPFCTVLIFLIKRRETEHPTALAAILAIACFSAHSLVDFNLQMPATGWVMAVIVATPFGAKSLEFKKKFRTYINDDSQSQF